jgi:ribonucleotide reductase beta subunit family protein with ferritin-like domain
MDKSSSIIKQVINNEQIVERAEKIAEILESFENNKTIDNFSYMMPIIYSSLELMRGYYGGTQSPFPTGFFKKRTQNKLKNK